MSFATAVRVAPRWMSVEEWTSLPEDEPGELVDGRLVEEEVPDFDHESVVGWLLVTFWSWVVPRGGFAFPSEGKFALRDGLGRKPDLSVFFPGGAVPPRHGAGRTPPDILVEVLSTSSRDVRRDRIDKTVEYAAFGVRFYWLVDPDERTFEIFELDPQGQYVPVLDATAGVLEAPGCEGLRLDLDALWTQVDRLG